MATDGRFITLCVKEGSFISFAIGVLGGNFASIMYRMADFSTNIIFKKLFSAENQIRERASGPNIRSTTQGGQHTFS